MKILWTKMPSKPHKLKKKLNIISIICIVINKYMKLKII